MDCHSFFESYVLYIISICTFKIPTKDNHSDAYYIENISKNFGGIRAVNDVSLTIETGSITGLIGPNGAGKTTLFNVIAGLYAPSQGRVFLDGENITGLAPHQLFSKGLLRTFQIAHEFSSLTVRENLLTVPAGQSDRAWTKESKTAGSATNQAGHRFTRHPAKKVP